MALFIICPKNSQCTAAYGVLGAFDLIDFARAGRWREFKGSSRRPGSWDELVNLYRFLRTDSREKDVALGSPGCA
jgi:hypothetical protein